MEDDDLEAIERSVLKDMKPRPGEDDEGREPRSDDEIIDDGGQSTTATDDQEGEEGSEGLEESAFELEDGEIEVFDIETGRVKYIKDSKEVPLRHEVEEKVNSHPGIQKIKGTFHARMDSIEYRYVSSKPREFPLRIALFIWILPFGCQEYLHSVSAWSVQTNDAIRGSMTD